MKINPVPAAVFSAAKRKHNTMSSWAKRRILVVAPGLLGGFCTPLRAWPGAYWKSCRFIADGAGKASSLSPSKRA